MTNDREHRPTRERPGRSSISVRRLEAAEWGEYRDLRLHALADSPDAFGSMLDYEQGRSDEQWRDRVATAAASPNQLPLVAVDSGEFVGLVWGWIDPANPETAHVYQMWVAPGHRGRGCGETLLAAVVEWARDATAREVELRVTCGDTAARRLYSRAGFEPVGTTEPLRAGSAILAQPMRLEFRGSHGRSRDDE